MDRPFRSLFGGRGPSPPSPSQDARLAELARALAATLSGDLERLLGRELDRLIAPHLAAVVSPSLHDTLPSALRETLPAGLDGLLRDRLEPLLREQVGQSVAKAVRDALAAELDPPLSAAVERAVASRLLEPVTAALQPLLPWTTLEMLRSAPVRAIGEAAIRARCQVVNLDARTALCRVLGRYKMYVDLRDAGFAPHLMFEGYWEYWNTEYVWGHVLPGQICLDVGANHGYFTLLLADLVGPSGTVHALEPNPHLFDLLSRTVALNGFAGHVHVHQAGAGGRRGQLPLLVPLSEPKNARLITEQQAREPVSQGREEVHRVPIVPLDELVKGPVDFIKIDVEGAEEAVWAGMQKLLDRSPRVRIAMELNPGRCADPRGLIAAISARFPLREIGFDGFSHPVTVEEVLARSEDTMLDLCADPA
jgi:FkbM family methyltransferase